MTLRLRPATVADAGLLLTWRNDPETRRFAFNRDSIAAGSHRAWVESSLALESRRIWIAEGEHGPVGQVRLDTAGDGVAVVDIATDPEHRGFGYAGAMLNEAEKLEPWGVSTLRAEVDPRNAASLHMFRKAGFCETARTERRVVLERRTSGVRPTGVVG